MNQIFLGDNLQILEQFPSETIQLIYIDPPFNTGTEQVGENGKYNDNFQNYLEFLRPRLKEARRILKTNGSLYFHIDYREAHYCKILLDEIFGRNSFINEIIWAYDYGGRTKKRWPPKHDTIFWYAKNPNDYIFNEQEVEREPYLSPWMASAEKQKNGKLPTDTWWHTIVSPNSKEKTGYPGQKPIALLKRIVTASSKSGDLIMDFFAGSGSFGVAAKQLGRNAVLIDNNPEAVRIMKARLL